MDGHINIILQRIVERKAAEFSLKKEKWNLFFCK